MSNLRLPLEVILSVIDSCVANFEGIALKPTDWRSKELRAWTLVSRATSEVAIRHLYSNCMYIDSPGKLMLLARLVSPPQTESKHPDHAEPNVPFRHLSYIRSIYIAPLRGHLDDLPASVWIFELFCILAPHLKRLAFDMPFGSLTPDFDHLGVYKYLRDGLERLTSLEELVYTCDDTNLIDRWPLASKYDGLWWCHFRSLKRLVLPYPNLPDAFASFMASEKNSLPPLRQVALHLWKFPRGGHRIRLDKMTGEGAAMLRIIQVHTPYAPRMQHLFCSGVSIHDHSRAELHSLTIPHHLEDLSRGTNLHTTVFLLSESVQGTLWSKRTVRHYDLRMELYRSDVSRLDLGGYGGLLWNIE